jgi:3-phenylpropionate/trans-cinnamate dioxygenase ferredoxin subunit
VARTADVPPGTMRAVRVGRAEVLLANVDGTFYAIGGLCTHQQGPLAEGSLWGAVVPCPYLGGLFVVRTGAVLDGPPPCPAVVVPVRVEGDTVQIAVRESQGARGRNPCRPRRTRGAT